MPGRTLSVATPIGAGAPHSGHEGLIRDVRVGRQAIYDTERRLVSYELLFQCGDEPPGAAPAGSAGAGSAGAGSAGAGSDADEGESATSTVIGSTFGTFGLESIADDKSVFITFTRAFLTGLLPIPVDPDSVVIEVGDRVVVDRELLLGLAELSHSGYRIAVDNYRGGPTRSPLLDVADVVKLDVRSLPGPDVHQLVRDCRACGAVLLATDVRDAETLQRCGELGFELFQGEYLQRPATLHRRVLSPSQLICTRLLNELGDPDAPMQRIEQLVGSDPGLVLRLLRSAHSAAGAGQEVESLRQALVLIGPRLLRSWVVLTLLDGTSTMNASDDLWTVLARAKACQRLAPGQPDLAYTIGLLVGAAELLGTDPATIADASAIGPEARGSLLHGDGEAGRALRAVLAHERHDGPAIDAVGLSRYDVSQTYLHSLQEALQLVHDIYPTP